MDLNELDLSEYAEIGAWCELVHPVTKEPLRDEKTKEPVAIQVLGTDSKRFQEMKRRTANKRIAKGLTKLTLEEVESEQINLLAACTMSWRHIICDGEELKFGQEAARRVYTRFPWIREQVDEFMGDRSRFFPTPPPT